MLCSKCSNPIPSQRLEVLPDTETCVNCSDVEKPIGFMAYGHKTAPSLIMISRNNKEALRQANRANKRSR